MGSREAAGCSRDAGAVQPTKAPAVFEVQKDQELFEERKRFAEDIARLLRKAGYSCDLTDSADIGSARTLERTN